MEMIRVNDLHKSFDGKVVHQGVSFYVNRGKCLGLIGGSGAGKSVILRALIGLEKPDRGQIYFQEQDVARMSEKDLIHVRRRISYVFQDGALFDSMTVFENLAFPLIEHTRLTPTEIERKVMATLNDFGLGQARNLYKSELSGGMQKRVGLARAMILEPQILLYDEPTAGLDPANTIKIQQLILTLKTRGNSSILVTHDMPTALSVCDDICLLHKGVIVAKCQASDLLEQDHHPINRFMKGDIDIFENQKTDNNRTGQ
jgi:phospholipid/cholesterol/gamma-HCH transport system ATP-binding protein